MLERRGSQHASASSYSSAPLHSHGRSKSLGGSLVGIGGASGGGVGGGNMSPGMGGMGGGYGVGVPMSPGGSLASPMMGTEIEWADIQAR